MPRKIISHRTRRRRIVFWRLVTLGGLAIALTSLFKQVAPQQVSATGRPGTPPSHEALELGFEPKDLDAHDITLVLATIAVSTALVIGIVFLMFWRFDITRSRSWSNITPQQTARTVPPAPRLQIDPFADLARQHDRENRLLHSWGWTSPDHSMARIPIERAMALSVGHSLDAGP